MGISVLTLGKFQKNQDKLVTLNLGHAGFEESVDSGQQVVGDGGMVCQKDVRVRGVAWRVTDVEMMSKTIGVGMRIKEKYMVWGASQVVLVVKNLPAT